MNANLQKSIISMHCFRLEAKWMKFLPYLLIRLSQKAIKSNLTRRTIFVYMWLYAQTHAFIFCWPPPTHACSRMANLNRWFWMTKKSIRRSPAPWFDQGQCPDKPFSKFVSLVKPKENATIKGEQVNKQTASAHTQCVLHSHTHAHQDER